MVFRRSFQALLAATVVGALLFLGSAAGAVDNPDYTAPPPTTPSTTTTPSVSQTVAQPKHVETAVAVTPVRSRLAITGSDVGQTAAVGAGLVLVGGVLLAARRRRPAAA